MYNTHWICLFYVLFTIMFFSFVKDRLTTVTLADL